MTQSQVPQAPGGKAGPTVWNRFWSPESYIKDVSAVSDLVARRNVHRTNCVWLGKWLPKYIVRWTVSWVGSQWFLALASDLDSSLLIFVGIVWLVRSTVRIGSLFLMLFMARRFLDASQRKR